jgi:hypothetical protein
MEVVLGTWEWSGKHSRQTKEWAIIHIHRACYLHRCSSASRQTSVSCITGTDWIFHMAQYGTLFTSIYTTKISVADGCLRQFTDDHKKAHMETLLELLQQYTEEDENFLGRVTTRDETLCSITVLRVKQNQ